MPKPNDVTVTIGEVVIDWISTEVGVDVGNAVNFGRFIGGNAVNVSTALARLGRQARLVGKIGADFHSLLLKERLSREKIDLDFLIEDPVYPTAQCYGFRNTDEETSYFNWPRPNASDMLGLDDITDAVFDRVCALHATGISLLVDPRRAAVLKAIEMAKERSLIFSFDAGFPTGHGHAARQSAELALSLSDILKVNLEELIFWTDSQPPSHLYISDRMEPPGTDGLAEIFAMTEKLRERHEPLVLFVTMGAAGSCIITKRFQRFCPSFVVEPEKNTLSSSVGAGDAFIAAIIDGLISRNLNDKRALDSIDAELWSEIVCRANAAGALATRSLSAVDGLPTANELDRFMASTRVQRQTDIR